MASTSGQPNDIDRPAAPAVRGLSQNRFGKGPPNPGGVHAEADSRRPRNGLSSTAHLTEARMRLGGLDDLRQALGGKVGRSYASALKMAAGMKGNRLFDIDAV